MSNALDGVIGRAVGAAEGVSAVLYASKALEAAGAWDRSTIIDVRGARRLTLLIDFTSDATGGTGAIAEIVPLRAFAADAPAAGAATWRTFADHDGIAVMTTLAAGTLPSGTDFSAAPNFVVRTFAGLVIRTDPFDNDTDVIQMSVELDVTSCRFVQLMAHEAGDTSNPGTLAIGYVLSC